jgi:hypothetical protein
MKSREDLGASGIDGVSYRIMKGAGTEGVKFMKIVSERVCKVGK